MGCVFLALAMSIVHSPFLGVIILSTSEAHGAVLPNSVGLDHVPLIVLLLT